MVAYSFRPRFVDPISTGTKRQTIRAYRSGRSRHAVPGEALQLFTGMRTAQCKLIGTATAEAVYPVQLFFGAHIRRGYSKSWSSTNTDPRFATYPTYARECNAFAREDGFKDWKELEAFWAKEHEGVDVFEGVLIRWRDFEANDRRPAA
ncbi:MAG: hypothetical protein GC155_06085 [Alphaproteobacteria bacterium]|nr:hypothetical protein [Alphaproteobacteria bacterium]